MASNNKQVLSAIQKNAAIAVLREYEGALSDGYGYYCGSENVTSKLEEIVEAIHLSIINNANMEKEYE